MRERHLRWRKTLSVRTSRRKCNQLCLKIYKQSGYFERYKEKGEQELCIILYLKRKNVLTFTQQRKIKEKRTMISIYLSVGISSNGRIVELN